MKPSIKLIELTVKALCKEAKADAIRPNIEAIDAEVLEEVKPLVSDEWAQYGEEVNVPITNWDDLYEAYDCHKEKCYKLKNEILNAQGYSLKKGYCPLLMAESEQREADRDMMNQAIAEFKLGFTLDDMIICGADKYQEGIEKVKAVVVSYCHENGISLEA